MDRREIWGRAYNFGVQQPLSALQITEKILAVMGRSDLRPIILNTAKAEIPEQHLSAARARGELGWTPRYTMEEGIAETVAWYRDHSTRNAGAGAGAGAD